MGIRIDALDTAASAADEHELPAMKDGITVKLTVAQINQLLADVLDPNHHATDAFARSNHTGTQAISTIVGLQTALNGNIAAIRQQVFAVSGTYTPDTHMLYCSVECLGGGGGGGGSAATSTGTINGAGGGGGGEYSQSFLTKAQIGASKAVVIGAAGGASATGNASGGTGGTTTLGGTLVTAVGGTGGIGAASSSSGGGGTGGTGGTGTLKVPGEKGSNGGLAAVQSVVLPLFGGKGGNSMFGYGGQGTVGGGGQLGSGVGAGGGGASDSTGAAKAGAAGLAGYIRITEYCSQ